MNMTYVSPCHFNVYMNFVNRSVDTRYTEMCQVAKSRSIISLGLSCFKIQPAAADDSKVAGKSLTFQVQTFNITLLCSENYVVEPLSLKFLVDHGFHFNKQYASGIPYYRGQDQVIVLFLYSFKD